VPADGVTGTVTWLVDVDGEVLMVTVVVAGCEVVAANGQELMVYMTSRLSYSCRGGTQPSMFGIQPASLPCSAAADASGADVCATVTVEEVTTEDVEREEANGQSLIVNIPPLFPFSFATP